MTGSRTLLRFGALSAFLASGYGVIFTVLDDYRDLYGIGEAALGLIIGIGFISGFAAQILLAPIADRGHARVMILFGSGLNLLGLLAMAFGTSLTPLLVGRLVMGLGVGIADPAIRRVVIVNDPANVGHNLGVLLAATVGGFAAGPIVSAALVGPFGLAAPFLLIAGVTGLATPLVMGAAKDTSEEAPEVRSRLALDLLRIRPFVGAVVMGCAVFVMIGAFDALWAVVLDDLNTSEWVANLGITLFALPLIVFGSAGGRLAQRLGPFRVGTFGLLAGSLFMLLYGLVPSGGAMFGVAMVHAINDGFTTSATSVAVAVTAPVHRQAGAQGLLGGAQTLSAGVIAVIVGVIYQSAGRAAAYGFTSAVMVIFVLAGLYLARDQWSVRPDNDAAVEVLGV
ncbi:MAG TPA: MFS transporter [Acidimicrobiales bacterium]|nr:MFS transporter [Acidimicrobiales bacterium]